MARLRPRHPGEPSWQWRRIFVFPLVVWLCIELHAMQGAPDTRVNETIAWGYVVLIAVLSLSYTGLATVQDVVAIWRTRSANPYDGSAYREPERPRDDDGLPEAPEEKELP